MEFLEKQGKNIAIVFAAVIIVGLALTLISQGSTKKEIKAQEDYIALDKKVKTYKDSLNNVNKDKKEVTPVVDVTQLKTELDTFVNAHLSTVASQVAALELVQLLTKENKTADAITVLQKVSTQSDLLSNAMVQMKLGQLLAESDKCSEAITIWQKVENNKALSYLATEAKLNKALCYKKMNEMAKAEEILNQIKNTKTGSEETMDASREADKILRLIQYNKQSGT